MQSVGNAHPARKSLYVSYHTKQLAKGTMARLKVAVREISCPFDFVGDEHE